MNANDFTELQQLLSVAIANGHQDRFHVRIDRTGRVLGVLPIAGTAKFSAQRLANLDVNAMGANKALNMPPSIPPTDIHK